MELMENLKAPKPIQTQISTIVRKTLLPVVKGTPRQGVLNCPISKGDIVHEGNVYSWRFYYNTTNYKNISTKNPVTMTLTLNPTVEGSLVVEANGLPTMKYKFPESETTSCNHLPYKQVYAAVNQEMEIRCTLELIVDADFIPGIRTDFHEYNNVLTDFQIHCGNDHYEVHKDVLSKISPVFEAMLRHNFVEKSSNKLKIDDFDFKTLETALNFIYGRPCPPLSVKLGINVLHFANKYNITDIFTQLEKVLLYNLSATNFCVILRYADDCAKTKFFAECAMFYKNNERIINITEDLTTLGYSLVIKLYKTAYNFETQLDAVLHARKDGIRLEIEQLKMTTLADFFQTVPYAWNYYKDLKVKCAKFYQQNKEIIEKRREYQRFSKAIQQELAMLACCADVANLNITCSEYLPILDCHNDLALQSPPPSRPLRSSLRSPPRALWAPRRAPSPPS
uniref:BTB domain-containing protein n=1 Tax=Panagrellus redivivus TaxID=6233 RepID=A0A7E5A1M1_PANRE